MEYRDLKNANLSMTSYKMMSKVSLKFLQLGVYARVSSVIDWIETNTDVRLWRNCDTTGKLITLNQRCPTHSPLATCDEWSFKCFEMLCFQTSKK